MLQNLKVDIIYHLTTSEFEMEFNMCGCCRMRLLTDKTADRKSLITALSRAVSRSRIIIACGPLFSAEGLIATVATAIGSRVTAVNNAAYGINGDDTINIIAGSTPLVTPEGYFGGCIIESGPQTIILLTENRAFRKSIMQTLIHPYIEEMSAIPVKGKSIPTPEPQHTEIAPPIVPAVTEEQSVETGDILAEEAALEELYALNQDENDDIEETVEVDGQAPDEIAQYNAAEEAMLVETEAEEEQESVPEPHLTEMSGYIVEGGDEEHEIPFVFDDTNEGKQMQQISEKIDEAYDTMYIEPERPQHIHTDRYAANYTPTEENDSFFSDAEYPNFGGGKKRRGNINIPIIILTVILLIIVGLLCYFLIVVPRMQNVSTTEYLQEIFDTVNNSIYI